MSRKKGTVLLSEQPRRISLRCPVILSSVKLSLDRESGKYSITAELEYPMSVTRSQSIRSVILVVRVPDKAGNAVLTADGSDLFAKQIRFGEEGFPCGESTAFSFAVDLAPGPSVRFGAPEVSISRIHFEDGSIVDYLRGDFFPVPEPPVPLEKKYNDEALAEIRAQLGEAASVVPEKLSPVVWRCVCGELCQEEECANCKSSRSAVFGYFGDTETILHPPFNFMRLMKISLITVGIIVVLLALTLTGILLVKNFNKPEVTTDPVTTIDPNIIDEPPQGSLASERVEFYLSAGRYEDAWEIADKEADAASMKPDICQAAIDYYKGIQDYDTAFLYGRRLVECRGDDASEATLFALYTEAYDYYVDAALWETACELAENTMQDSDRLASAAKSWIDALKSGNQAPTHTSERFAECLWVAERYVPEDSALIKSIVDEGVADFIAEKKFTEAEELAKKDPDGGTELLYDIRKAAVEYYLEQEDYLRAFETAGLTDDAELVQSVCEQIPDSELRANLPSYISYLRGVPDKLRTVLASTIAQDRFAARVNEDGSVSFGANRLFEPTESGYTGTAVSVAVGREHTAVLLDTGRVVILDRDGLVDRSASQSLTGAVAISAAGDYTILLLETGRVKIVGDAPFNSTAMTKISGFTDVISVAAGEGHALFLQANGTVAAVGDNGKGQCGTASWTGIVQIAAGASHSVGLKSDGTLVGCGSDANGRMDFSGWTDVIAISAGQSATAALKRDGSVLYTGGVIGAEPADPTGLTGITEIAAGQFGMIFKDNRGRIRSIGQWAPDVSGFPDR